MDFQVPCGIFFSRIPHGKVMTGTEDAKVFAIPYPGLRPLICSYSFKGGRRSVATTMFLRMLQNICYPVSDWFGEIPSDCKSIAAS